LLLGLPSYVPKRDCETTAMIGRRYQRFFVGCLGLAVVWGWLLPWLNQRASIERYIAAMRSAGVNPSAVYYTEHPNQRQWEQTIDEKLR
jgi:hypothetical protein